jgi:VanZ family protein
MTARSEKGEADFESSAGWRSHAWRYGPVLLWMVFIFFASTNQFSASNTSRIIRPLLLWLFPEMSEERLLFTHFLVRKGAHLSEYAVFGLLTARAFISSPRVRLRRRWFLYSLMLISLYAFGDEFHQLFVSSRTGSIYDSFIDITGGTLALLLLALWRKVKKR